MSRGSDERFEQAVKHLQGFTPKNSNGFEARELRDFLQANGLTLSPQQVDGVLRRMTHKRQVIGESRADQNMLYKFPLKGDGEMGGKNGGGARGGGRLGLDPNMATAAQAANQATEGEPEKFTPGPTFGKVRTLRKSIFVLGLQQTARSKGYVVDFNSDSLKEEPENQLQERLTSLRKFLQEQGKLEDCELAMDLAERLKSYTVRQIMIQCGVDKDVAKSAKDSYASDLVLTGKDSLAGWLQKLPPVVLVKKEEKQPFRLPLLLQNDGLQPVPVAGGEGDDDNLFIENQKAERGEAKTETVTVEPSAPPSGQAPSPTVSNPQPDLRDQQIADLTRQKDELEGELSTITEERNALDTKFQELWSGQGHLTVANLDGWHTEMTNAITREEHCRERVLADFELLRQAWERFFPDKAADFTPGSLMALRDKIKQHENDGSILIQTRNSVGQENEGLKKSLKKAKKSLFISIGISTLTALVIMIGAGIGLYQSSVDTTSSPAPKAKDSKASPNIKAVRERAKKLNQKSSN